MNLQKYSKQIYDIKRYNRIRSLMEKKPWKTRMERDIIMHEDVRASGLQGGKILADKLSLFSFIMGIPLVLIGLYGLISMVFDLGFPFNTATMILVMVVLSLGSLFTIGGYFLYVKN
jgi:hypothetical protein